MVHVQKSFHVILTPKDDLQKLSNFSVVALLNRLGFINSTPDFHIRLELVDVSFHHAVGGLASYTVFPHGSVEVSVEPVDAILDFPLLKKTLEPVPGAPFLHLSVHTQDNTA